MPLHQVADDPAAHRHQEVRGCGRASPRASRSTSSVVGCGFGRAGEHARDDVGAGGRRFPAAPAAASVFSSLRTQIRLRP